MVVTHKPTPVIVLDGEQRSALAATRSLGTRGIPVIVGTAARHCMSAASRYCTDSFTYSSPRIDEDAFFAAVRNAARKFGASVVLPMTDVTTPIILARRDELAPAAVPGPGLANYQLASDKWRLLELAQRLDVPIPRTEFLEPGSNPADLARRLPFPMVLKPARSQLRLGSQTVTTAVRIAHSLPELQRYYESDPWLAQGRVLAQELIGGHGAGIFAAYDHGREVAVFAHRRLREKPPWGGVSVLSESAPIDEQMRDMAGRLLRALDWHGAAMVEFKVDPVTGPRLMEINGRLWGSLQLAIDAGVDFPWILYALCQSMPVQPIADYAVGVRSRWLLGDVDNLITQLRHRACCPTWRHRLRAIGAFMRSFGARPDVMRWSDMGPFMIELSDWIRASARR